jgi:ribose 1,5-bisphosphokinase PhnN
MIIRRLTKLADKSTVFRPELIPKYTTRPSRRDDRGEVICVRDIPPQCDLVYVHCEMRYGLELNSLFQAIDQGKSPLVILNDVRAVEDVRNLFKGSVKSLFTFRKEPSLERYRELAKVRGVKDLEEPERRFQAAQALHRIYIENIHLFDHVILNTSTARDLNAQLSKVIHILEEGPSQPRKAQDRVCGQRLVVVFGTPGSGKDLLIRAVNDLGSQHARIVPKHTSKEWENGDGDEVIYPGEPEHNLDNCDLSYEYLGHRYGVKYGGIWGGLRRGVFQVVSVGNLDAIDRLRDEFGELMLLIYVHSEIDGERRGLEKGQSLTQHHVAFDVYLSQFLAFDHVLINSGVQQDLFDQIFRLFRAYERNLGHVASNSPISERVWAKLASQTPKIIGGPIQLPIMTSEEETIAKEKRMK